ncbi:DUF4294 domain-containing protein [Lentimicrobium sp.]|jgi:hypothetical protein|uniref:DUF4294 domain-containing protein n=1 Tax=Lentimicrobium sp. TaxID=2034841 RepID=UPI002C62C51C|nr:DUF4294 domain-containing protein [Lentimicrobium sp.]MCO5261692.1 DUF4294 domain-containing protein [Lentimicrobium sp.]HOP12444.1 DUF4294 domain-containing protein [Lentimicrobium sp.]HPF64028.1 DUF4294 domain-containing protein [Lentimicrobium sp.]HPR26596.1 DUF4294 domain-containing protein [Lentimicrobium sp.]HRW69186.1 DUF4294 domain-containing protein [Lentimicrobium sp.]
MKRLFLIAILFALFSGALYAQHVDVIVLKARVVNGDTLPQITLPEVNIRGFIIFRSPADQRRFDRLVRNVKKVYPYAKLAGIKLNEYEAMMAGLPEKEQRKLLKRAEDELKAEFGDELKALNFTQGKILLKLVDRETGNPTYHIVRELRGSFVAFFWQNLSRLFGYNLKEKYDPEGKDRDIETIVTMIENGLI